MGACAKTPGSSETHRMPCAAETAEAVRARGDMSHVTECFAVTDVAGQPRYYMRFLPYPVSAGFVSGIGSLGRHFGLHLADPEFEPERKCPAEAS